MFGIILYMMILICHSQAVIVSINDVCTHYRHIPQSKCAHDGSANIACLIRECEIEQGRGDDISYLFDILAQEQTLHNEFKDTRGTWGAHSNHHFWISPLDRFNVTYGLTIPTRQRVLEDLIYITITDENANGKALSSHYSYSAPPSISSGDIVNGLVTLSYVSIIWYKLVHPVYDVSVLSYDQTTKELRINMLTRNMKAPARFGRVYIGDDTNCGANVDIHTGLFVVQLSACNIQNLTFVRISYDNQNVLKREVYCYDVNLLAGSATYRGFQHAQKYSHVLDSPRCVVMENSYEVSIDKCNMTSNVESVLIRNIEGLLDPRISRDDTRISIKSDSPIFGDALSINYDLSVTNWDNHKIVRRINECFESRQCYINYNTELI